MPIRINTVKAQLQIRTTKGKIEIQQPKGELEIKQKRAKMIISGERPKVIIDQYQCFAESGLKNNADLAKQFAALGKRRVMEGISRRTFEGRRMMNIKIGNPNAISELAMRNSQPKTLKFNYDIMPKSRPSIEIEGGQSIDWELGGVEVNYTPRNPIISFKKGKIEVYLSQKPSIDIRYIDEKR